MQYYKLLISGSNEVISIFEWDEIASGSVTASITFPSGTLLQEVSASASFTSSADYGSAVNVGEFAGFFTGSVYVTESDIFNINNNFIVYSPSASNSGSIQIGLSGSLNVSGSVVADIFTGSFTGSFKGNVEGTSSYTISSSYSITASYAKFAETGSQVETIIKSQNWTPPTWAKKIKVVCIGGGGGGGSAPADEDGITLYSGGGGGGGGTVTLGEFKIQDIGTGSISIVVGTGGLGGNESRGGTQGGDTLFGNYLIAKGGWGGTQGDTNQSVTGGLPRTNINYTNTGGGAGGRGSSTGFTPSIGVVDECVAPPVPIPQSYLNKPQYFLQAGNIVPIPSSIAPTGGGGGLGISQPSNVRNDGDTTGGTLKLNNYNTLSMIPVSYNSSSHQYYPAFNTKIGLGGKGGNPYLLSGPTDGTMYGGGGGGAFAGGVTGSYPTGFPNGTGYNYGANGAMGAVIIISET